MTRPFAGSFAPSGLTSAFSRPFSGLTSTYGGVQGPGSLSNQWSAHAPNPTYLPPGHWSGWQASQIPSTLGAVQPSVWHRPPTPWNSGFPQPSTLTYAPSPRQNLSQTNPTQPGVWSSLVQGLSNGVRALWPTSTPVPLTHMSRRPPKWPRPGTLYPGTTKTIAQMRHEGLLPSSQVFDDTENRISLVEGEWRIQDAILGSSQAYFRPVH
jgi:hypothetical protein